MNLRRTSPRVFVLFLLCMTTFLVNNGAFYTDVQEARTLVSAREMVECNNWTVPTVNGELMIEKPPLATWIAATIESMRPNNVSAQRTAMGVMGIMWALFFFATARYLYRKNYFAEVATIVFLTCYNIIYIGRVVNREIYGYAFMMAAIYFILRMLYDDRYFDNPHKWRWAVLAGLMLGLSELGNGVVAFYTMLLPAMVALICFRKPTMTGKWGAFVLMIVIFVASFIWWYVYLWYNHPEAISRVISLEAKNWLAPSKYPWFYYWRFFAEMGVWCVFVLASLLVPYWRKRVPMKRQYYIAITWMLLGLLLLSVMPNKEMIRLLPLATPCSLAVACIVATYQERTAQDKFGKFLFAFNGGVFATVMLLLPFFIHFKMFNKGLADFGTTVFVGLLIIILFLLVVNFIRRRDMVQIVWCVAAIFVVMECFMLVSVRQLFGNPNQHSINVVQRIDELRDLTFYHSADETIREEVVYEVNRKVLPLNLNNEQEVLNAIPCVLVSQNSLAQELPASLLQKIDTTRIGIFDDNNLPPRSRIYNHKLVNQVSILKLKKSPTEL